MNITLYSMPGCGMCAALSQMLDQKKIKYTKIHSEDECANMGFTNLPVLVVDDQQYTFGEAIAWLNNREGEI